MSRGDRCQRRSSPVTGSFPDVCYVAQFTVGGALDRHQSTNYSSLALCKTVVNGNRPSCSHRFHLRLRRRRPGIPSSAAASRMSLPHTSLFRVCVVVNVIESPGEKKKVQQSAFRPVASASESSSNLVAGRASFLVRWRWPPVGWLSVRFHCSRPSPIRSFR